ncbi:lysophospholipid acyltransferase family protein [Acrocarpospora catenulata]|uniref:lysophospholipid acyltransferase family protein n=1 Tax=Acrocarpospora catenulata TaxID=2836182 RepID=UPI001BDA3D91|nr:lysophospholipid acyltransferase family protein [Acrocarpospora catenulata]
MTVTAIPPAVTPWQPLAPCEPETCVSPALTEASRARRVARAVGAVTVLLGGVPVAMAARWMSMPRRGRITRGWARLLLRALGVKLEQTRGFAYVAGVPLLSAVPDTSGTLLVANHVSWMDPLVMAATMPCRPLAKSEVGEWPVIRTLARGAGALFIHRDQLLTLPLAVAGVAGALRDGDTVVAFPEGTTWCGTDMGPFRPAVFQAALDAGAAVRPATIRYHEGPACSARTSYVGGDSLVGSIARTIGTKDLTVTVTLFPPVRLTPAGRPHEARKALAGVAEAQVRTGLNPTPHHHQMIA